MSDHSGGHAEYEPKKIVNKSDVDGHINFVQQCCPPKAGLLAPSRPNPQPKSSPLTDGPAHHVHANALCLPFWPRLAGRLGRVTFHFWTRRARERLDQKPTQAVYRGGKRFLTGECRSLLGIVRGRRFLGTLSSPPLRPTLKPRWAPDFPANPAAFVTRAMARFGIRAAGEGGFGGFWTR